MDGDDLFGRFWKPLGYEDSTEPGGGEGDAGVEGRLRVPVGYTDTGEPIYDDGP